MVDIEASPGMAILLYSGKLFLSTGTCGPHNNVFQMSLSLIGELYILANALATLPLLYVKYFGSPNFAFVFGFSTPDSRLKEFCARNVSCPGCPSAASS